MNPARTSKHTHTQKLQTIEEQAQNTQSKTHNFKKNIQEQQTTCKNTNEKQAIRIEKNKKQSKKNEKHTHKQDTIIQTYLQRDAK